MLHAVRKVRGPVLWANLHLLFWLSLIPFVTEWLGENHFAEMPVALHGGVPLMAGVAYTLPSRTSIKHNGKDSTLASAIGRDVKGKALLLIDAAAIPVSFASRPVALGLYIPVAVQWLIPDRRMEKVLDD